MASEAPVGKLEENASVQATGFAIEARNLRKVFGDKVAVRNLSLSVPRGEIFGFLGPNGAGKSTSIKMLLGLVTPSGGQAYVLEAPSGSVEIRRKVGFLPEDFRFYQWLTATELLEFHGRLCGMDARRLRDRVPYLIDLVGLGPHRGKRLQGFSKGMMQRIGLAQALIHDPEIVFLDEPTSGLDPMGRRLVRDIIRAQRDRGATVFLNSHILSEIEITCDQVAFIRDGEIVTTRDLRGWHEERVRVKVRARRLEPQIIAGLSRWASCDQLDGDTLMLTACSREVLPEILGYLVQCGTAPFEFTPHRISLEDLFMEIVGEDRGL